MVNVRPVLSTEETYHVFNRTNGKEKVFNSQRHIAKLHTIIDYYRYEQRLKLSNFKALTEEGRIEYIEELGQKTPLVEIYAFAIMPNHYHLLLKQIQDKGISRFISNTQNSFAKYYNLVENRLGSIFQSNFKGKRILNNEEFIHVSRYIHLNPVTSSILSFIELLKSPMTSLSLYKATSSFLTADPILNYFGNFDEYIRFVHDQKDYQRSLHLIKARLIE